MEASRARGVSDLLDSALTVARQPATFRPARPEIAAPHREVLAEVLRQLGDDVPLAYEAEWVALKRLEGDREAIELARHGLPAPAWHAVETLLGAHEDAVIDISAGRYEWIGRMVRAAVRRPRLGQVSLTDRLNRFALHPVWEPLLLLSLFALVFALTFEMAGPVQRWLDTGVVSPLR
jgi:ferrous iron transport protein B